MTTVGDFFIQGGFLMWPILGCSVVVVGLAIERYLSLRGTRVVPTEVEDAVEQVRKGRADAISAGMAASNAPAARVLTAGLRRRGCLLSDVEKAMEDQLAEETALLRGNIRGITLMAAVAPLLGLLGTVQGIAQALFEEAVYDENGQLLSGSLMDYAVPKADDLLNFELDRTETPSPVNALGVKGIGEARTIASSAAVVNAVVDALAPLGVKHLDMPLKPERVWQAIQQAQARR